MKLHPESTAATANEGTLTYDQLNRRANQLAEARVEGELDPTLEPDRPAVDIPGFDPREGYFKKQHFYHPELEFQFIFPSGWKTASPFRISILCPRRP